MVEAMDGQLTVEAGRYVIRFERQFATSLDNVWAALTQPEQLRHWFGANEIELELVEGGRFVTRTTEPQELVDAIRAEAGDVPLETRDTVLRVEPPHVFEHTFGGAPESIVRWELEADGDGCLLRLRHTEPVDFEPKHGPRDLAGWHELLDLLRVVLEGGAGISGGWSRGRWEAHRDRYARELEERE